MSNVSGLWWWEDFASASRSRRRFIGAFIAVIGLAMSILLIGGLSQSKIGLTDENDLPQYVGTKGYVALNDIPRLLIEKTEIGDFGKGQRFRPIYFLSRITETALWGLNGSYWYAWRTVLFGLVIAAMMWLCTQCVGLVLGATLAIFTLSFAMWVDIWTRSTGPSEQYAALGTAIYAVASWHFIQHWRSKSSLNGASVLMALGAIIAMGSKENMLLLELPLFAAVAAGLWFGRLSFFAAFFLLLAIAFGVWIVSSIVVYFLWNRVEDIYGNSLRASLLHAKGMIVVYICAIVGGASVLTTDLLLRKIEDKEKLARYRSLTAKYGLAACVLVVVFVFNDIFYTGQLPAHFRYDFPAILTVPALLILLLWSVGDTVELFPCGSDAKRAIGWLLLGGLVIYSVLVPWNYFSAVKTSVARNGAFDAGLNLAQQLTRQHPDWPVFIKSFNYLDLEPIQALGTFFVARQITNPRYLVYVPNPYGEARNSWQQGLEDGLLEESAKGMAARGYLPLEYFEGNPEGNCFVLVLRNKVQFAVDKANNKNPSIGDGCRKIPSFVYWDRGVLNIDRPDTSSR